MNSEAWELYSHAPSFSPCIYLWSEAQEATFWFLPSSQTNFCLLTTSGLLLSCLHWFSTYSIPVVLEVYIFDDVRLFLNRLEVYRRPSSPSALTFTIIFIGVELQLVLVALFQECFYSHTICWPLWNVFAIRYLQPLHPSLIQITPRSLGNYRLPPATF